MVGFVSAAGLFLNPAVREVAISTAGATAAVSGALVTLTLGYEPHTTDGAAQGVLAVDLIAFAVSGIAAMAGRYIESRDRQRAEQKRHRDLNQLIERQAADIAGLRAEVALLLSARTPAVRQPRGRRRPP